MNFLFSKNVLRGFHHAKPFRARCFTFLLRETIHTFDHYVMLLRTPHHKTCNPLLPSLSVHFLYYSHILQGSHADQLMIISTLFTLYPTQISSARDLHYPPPARGPNYRHNFYHVNMLQRPKETSHGCDQVSLLRRFQLLVLLREIFPHSY